MSSEDYLINQDIRDPQIDLQSINLSSDHSEYTYTTCTTITAEVYFQVSYTAMFALTNVQAYMFV